jgi:hypothetical protein
VVTERGDAAVLEVAADGAEGTEALKEIFRGALREFPRGHYVSSRRT